MLSGVIVACIVPLLAINNDGEMVSVEQMVLLADIKSGVGDSDVVMELKLDTNELKE